MKTKKAMSDDLNALLGLRVDWSRLTRSDAEQVHRALTEDMTLSQALNLNAASLRLRIGSMPILQLLRERAELSRRYYQKQAVHQPAIIPPPHPPMSLQQPPSSLQPQPSQQKKQGLDYVC